MRLVENTPSRVMLRDRRVWAPLLALAGAGLMLFLAAAHPTWETLWPGPLIAFIGLALLRSNVVVFDKDRGTCTLARADIVRRTRRELAFDEISDLRIEPSPRGGGINAMSCRFALVAGPEVIPLTAGYEPGPERYRIMREAVLGVLSSEGPQPA